MSIQQQKLIEAERAAIVAEIEFGLMNMRDVIIDTGRKIHAEEVVDQMQTRDPDRFQLGVYLAGSMTQEDAKRGQEILHWLRVEAISVLIHAHRNNIYALASSRVTGEGEAA